MEVILDAVHDEMRRAYLMVFWWIKAAIQH